jgi:hypothetical protein
MIRQLVLAPLILIAAVAIKLRCVIGSSPPGPPWALEPIENLRSVRDAEGRVVMCSTCGGTGHKPMPWRHIPGFTRVDIGVPPTRRNPAGWGLCPDCRYGKPVEVVK